MTLPDLGVGLIYLPGLEPVLEAGQDLLDVVEIEPQTLWFRGAAGYRAREEVLSRVDRLPQRKLVHGVGFPVGGTRPPDPAALRPFADTVRRLDAPWCSEHLSFNRVDDDGGGFDTLFLLPPVQSAETVRRAAGTIRAVRPQLPVPFAFETGVNYLRPRPGELTDGAFFAGVAEQADCGILLDLHNLWCNERNGRQPVREVLAELPLERVWEMHLAGGQELDGFWLDAHSGPVPDELLSLAAEVIPTLPALRALIFEMVPDHLTAGRVGVAELVDQLARLRTLWDTRGTRVARLAPVGRPSAVTPLAPVGRPSAAGPVAPVGLPSAADWEAALGGAAVGREDAGALAASVRADPGTGIVRQLVDQVRAGRVVDTMRYTHRLVVLSHGEDRFAELLRTF